MIIISGDQTGVERAALNAALKNKLEINGYCIKERLAEDDILSSKYKLIELETNSYSTRNEENFKIADKMLILNISNIKFDNEKLPFIEGKESKTIELKEDFEENKDKIPLIATWIKKENVQKLFITGQKQSNNDSVDIYNITYTFLDNLFKILKKA
ncbi:2567_t:CDS:1 [Cetraspora pellucida]|uniref:2567_t:CDS:1 n=1 Tax=Cetraspora pellucida TaxID=1433469 RepID=A0A9N9BT50_9GLOM|nr:2567_t:CDS:1 [Cetraspora pellucida]